jgi:putative hydrolase of the HAD superfamily
MIDSDSKLAAPTRVLTIDLDDTLWPCLPVIHAAELALFDWLGRYAPRVVERHTVESLREHRVRLMHACPEIAHDVTAVRRESLRLLMREYGHAERLADAASEHFLSARNQVEPYNEVVDSLVRLRTSPWFH